MFGTRTSTLILGALAMVGASSCSVFLQQRRAPLAPAAEVTASEAPSSAEVTGPSALALAAAPATPPPPPLLPATPTLGERISLRAAALVGARLKKIAKAFPDDCAGFVRLAYARAGVMLMQVDFLPGENSVSALYREARAAGALRETSPRAGELIFFKETYDRNRDGRRNDGMTHVAVVETVDAQGTITFVHRGKRGVTRSRMNLEAPRARRSREGEPLNDFLRPAKGKLRGYLTGELFAGFASPEGWTPRTPVASARSLESGRAHSCAGKP
jgi:hypothetical protein